MPVLCYADHDFFFFFFLSHEKCWKHFNMVLENIQRAQGSKEDSFSLTQTHQHQSIPLISREGMSGEVGPSEEAHESCVCSWFSCARSWEGTEPGQLGCIAVALVSQLAHSNAEKIWSSAPMGLPLLNSPISLKDSSVAGCLTQRACFSLTQDY